jgi:polyhydroxyalkanoate synthesis regulator protein
MKRVLNADGTFSPYYKKKATATSSEVRSLQEQNQRLLERLEKLEAKQEPVKEVEEVERVVDEVVDFSMSMTKDQLEEVASQMGIPLPKNAKKKDIYDLIVLKKEEDAMEEDDSEEDESL